MAAVVFVLGVVALTVVAPIWIVFHYITKWRAQKTLSAVDEAAIAELWDSVRRMENRILNLERVVKDERAEGRY